MLLFPITEQNKNKPLYFICICVLNKNSVCLLKEKKMAEKMKFTSLVGTTIRTKINYPLSTHIIEESREKKGACACNKSALGKYTLTIWALEQWGCQLYRRQPICIWKEQIWFKSLLSVPEDSHSPASPLLAQCLSRLSSENSISSCLH